MARTIYPGAGEAPRRRRVGVPMQYCRACSQPSVAQFEARVLQTFLSPAPGVDEAQYCGMCREKHRIVYDPDARSRIATKDRIYG